VSPVRFHSNTSLAIFYTYPSLLVKICHHQSDLFPDCLTGTEEVKPYKVTLTAEAATGQTQTFAITLIDCPGFDDPAKPDSTIITSILNYLNDTYHRGKKLHGIIYMSNICNHRIGGTDRRNIAMFQRLCGMDFYQNVVLGTTHWDELENVEVGYQRLEELRTNPDFWGQFADKGSKLKRINGNETQMVLDIAWNHHPRLLHAQEEMRKGLKAAETSAAREADVWNFYFDQQRRRFDEIRQRRESVQEQLALNRAQWLREFRDFENNISIEQRELAMQRARIQEELEFQRLANLDDEGDQISLRDKEREHRRNIQQMEEELREKERDRERRTREESHEVRAKCRRVQPDRVRCEVRGCGVIIDPKREQYYRKSCNHAPAIIRFMWYMTDSGILKQTAVTVVKMTMTTA
jgi:hypothetical protein